MTRHESLPFEKRLTTIYSAASDDALVQKSFDINISAQHVTACTPAVDRLQILRNLTNLVDLGIDDVIGCTVAEY